MTKQKAETGNKYISASIGVVSTVQAAIEEGFEKLVARGEVARKDYRTSIVRIRADVGGDVAKQVEKAGARVATRASNILNLPTSKDIDTLNKKLDRVIKKVAA